MKQNKGDEVNKDFKLTIDNLKKYKNWSLNIKEIYGFKINQIK